MREPRASRPSAWPPDAASTEALKARPCFRFALARLLMAIPTLLIVAVRCSC
jgi:hypothetical protein